MPSKILLFIHINILDYTHLYRCLANNHDFAKKNVDMILSFVENVETISLFLFVFVLVGGFFADGQHHSQHKNGKDFVQRIHKSTLYPFWYCGTGVRETQFLQDIIYTVRLYALSRPRK